MKPRNEPIGEVDCPHKGCERTAKVYRFRPRGAPERKTVFSGKLYCECPDHGRIGADGNSTVNEYLLRNAKIWSPGPASTDASKKDPPPTPAARKAPEPPPAPARSPWRTLLD